jgi:hypothetical protein
MYINDELKKKTQIIAEFGCLDFQNLKLYP